MRPLGDDLPPLPESFIKLAAGPINPKTGFKAAFDSSVVWEGVPDGKRDDQIFRYACQLRALNAPEQVARDLVGAAAARCKPPLDEWEKKLDQAWKYPAGKNGANGQAQQTRPEFHIQFMSMKELLALPPDPTRWIWDQTLPVAGTSILVSKPKIGKSTFAANLAVAVARGIPFLGRNTQQSPVAYLSLDASLPEMIETFQPFQPRDTDPIFIHAGAAPKEAVAEIMKWVRENDARFVIVDTLQRLFRFQNVNDYSEVTNAIEPLTEAAREQQIHVMFLHHAKKDAGDDLDSAIGSTAIRGLAYTYLHMKRLPDSDRRIIRSDQRGGKNFSELAIGFDRVTGWLDIRGTMEDAEIEEAEPKIIEFLQEASDGGTVEKDILRAVTLRAVIVSKALRQLFKNNNIERTGKGRKGDPFRYSVATTLTATMDGHPYSLPRMGGLGGRIPGRESQNNAQDIENITINSLPKGPGREREEREENLFSGVPGRESEGTVKRLGIVDENGWAKVR